MHMHPSLFCRFRCSMNVYYKFYVKFCIRTSSYNVVNHLSTQSNVQPLKKVSQQVPKPPESVKEEPNPFFTVPNALTISRIALSPFIGYWIVTGSNMPALVGTIFSGLSDGFDGYIARRFPSQQSKLGSLLDPLADKLFGTSLSLSLAWASILPVPLVCLFLGKDILMVLLTLYTRFHLIPSPKRISSFFNPTVAPIQIKPLLISKLNTALQIALYVLALSCRTFEWECESPITLISYLAAGTTVASAAAYLVVFRRGTW